MFVDMGGEMIGSTGTAFFLVILLRCLSKSSLKAKAQTQIGTNIVEDP